MKKMFLVLITVILLICFVGCKEKEEKLYDKVTVSDDFIINDLGTEEMKITNFKNNKKVSYINYYQDIDKLFELINFKYVYENEVIALGLDPCFYLIKV